MLKFITQYILPLSEYTISYSK